LAAIVSPPIFAGLFKLFTSEGWPYFPGAPFLLAAFIMVLAFWVFIKQPQRQYEPDR
jgi:MFS family permease